jgi:inositol 1,4,5-triphosphate receptor type 1
LNFPAKLLSRAGRTLHEVQSHLDREGASDLVVELVIKSVHSPSIFVEAVELGSALLEGGNPIIQKSMYSKLMGGDLSQAFFKVSLYLFPCILICCYVLMFHLNRYQH